MNAIRFYPNVPADVRAIEQKAAMTIPEAIHRYAETGAGRVKPLELRKPIPGYSVGVES